VEAFAVDSRRNGDVVLALIELDVLLAGHLIVDRDLQMRRGGLSRIDYDAAVECLAGAHIRWALDRLDLDFRRIRRTGQRDDVDRNIGSLPERCIQVARGCHAV
jgi:hypothetical protein